MSEHKYYTDWGKFWDFYMQSTKDDIGEFKFQALKNSSARITQNLKRISDEFRLGVLDDLIREAGMIPNDILLYYDPKATTFYSAYSRKKKRFYIGYPTFTKYMCYWEPAMKAAFRHEMGHILRGDCLLTMPFSDVRNANCCMDIRINDQLSRSGLLEVYKCMNFKDKDQSLLVPEEQFGKIDLPYDEDNPYIPEWWIIANKFNKANKRQKQENDKEQDKEEPKGFEIGDYVIINTNESPYNGDPGKIVDIDEEGNYVVESISEEEFNSLMDAVKESRMQLTTSGDLLGVFTKSQIISAIPEEEGQQGEYGDDDDGDEGQGGDSGGDDDDGESGDGESGDGESGDGEGADGKGDENKTPEDIIKEKEEILEDLLNGGVDGNNQGDGVWSDELSEDEDEDVEDGSGSGSQSDTEQDENEADSKVNEEEGEEKAEGEGQGEAEGKGENEKEEESDFDANDIPDWTEEQTKRKEDLEEKIKDINLTKNINKSIDNFNSIKLKHKDKLTQEEMMYIDVALEELEELKQ